MDKYDRNSRFDTAGWALFFIWVGVVWLADVGIGIGLLGVATITLGMQALRKVCRVRVDGFWVLVGVGIGAAGIWQLTGIDQPLAPFFLIAAGVALLIWNVWSRSGHRDT